MLPCITLLKIGLFPGWPRLAPDTPSTEQSAFVLRTSTRKARLGECVGLCGGQDRSGGLRVRSVSNRQPSSQGEHRNIVVLAELLRSGGNGIRRLDAESSGALKAKQCSAFFACFYHTIGEQGELLALGQMEDGLSVGCLRGKSQRQTTFKRDFLPCM